MRLAITSVLFAPTDECAAVFVACIGKGCEQVKLHQFEFSSPQTRGLTEHTMNGRILVAIWYHVNAKGQQMFEWPIVS